MPFKIIWNQLMSDDYHIADLICCTVFTIILSFSQIVCLTILKIYTHSHLFNCRFFRLQGPFLIFY